VSLFDTVFNETTWDIHGYQPFSPASFYEDHVGPMFDMAYSALPSELSERDLLRNTMLVATGEFGWTPRINAAGGRDHWPHCWSMLMAERSSDLANGDCSDNLSGLGVEHTAELRDACGRLCPLLEPGTEPVHELFI
jgi:Protein of unknown function (DUF1501)